MSTFLSSKLKTIVIATSLTLPFAITQAQAETVVKIGFSSPLSGPQSHYGKDNQNGAVMAVDELNARKLKIGGDQVKFVLVSEDDQADPRVGTTAAQRLVDAGVKGILGHFNSGVTIPASRIYAKAGLPQLSVSTNPTYTKQGLKSAFRLVSSDEQVGGALGKFVAKDIKAKTIVVIDDRTAFGQGVADDFVKTIAAQGGKVAKREYTNDKATDFTAILTSSKALNPDVIFYGGADPQAAPMAKQMKKLGLNARLVGADMMRTDAFLKLAGDAANGQLAGVPGGVISARPTGKAFESRYVARFKQPVGLYAAHFYDGMMMIASAMQKANSVQPNKYLPELAKINYVGASSDFAFDAKGDLKKPAVTISEVKGGKWVVRSVTQ